jgi:hypothetical protein
MDPSHLRQHIDELRGRLPFLRALRPDSDRYKLWLGDVVELVNVAYGLDSPQMARLRATLREHARLPPDATEADRGRLYLDRLDALTALLDEYAYAIREPIVFFEEPPT